MGLRRNPTTDHDTSAYRALIVIVIAPMIMIMPLIMIVLLIVIVIVIFSESRYWKQQNRRPGARGFADHP